MNPNLEEGADVGEVHAGVVGGEDVDGVVVVRVEAIVHVGYSEKCLLNWLVYMRLICYHRFR